jgi:hypothetical protein
VLAGALLAGRESSMTGWPFNVALAMWNKPMLALLRIMKAKIGNGGFIEGMFQGGRFALEADQEWWA